MNSKKSLLSDLLAQKAALEQQIADTQRAERAEALAQIRTLMTQYGLTLADLGSRATGPRPGAAAAPAPAAQPAARGKVAPKYRDTATGQTWSGRGLKPKWLQAALDSGRSLSDFTI